MHDYTLFLITSEWRRVSRHRRCRRTRQKPVARTQSHVRFQQCDNTAIATTSDTRDDGDGYLHNDGSSSDDLRRLIVTRCAYVDACARVPVREHQ